jgi:hypothetical protein
MSGGIQPVQLGVFAFMFLGVAVIGIFAKWSGSEVRARIGL